MPRPLTVRKRANSLRGFILICHKQVVKTLEAYRLEEPFSRYSVLCLSKHNRYRSRYIDQIILYRKATQAKKNPHTYTAPATPSAH